MLIDMLNKFSKKIFYYKLFKSLGFPWQIGWISSNSPKNMNHLTRRGASSAEKAGFSFVYKDVVTTNCVNQQSVTRLYNVIC